MQGTAWNKGVHLGKTLNLTFPIIGPKEGRSLGLPGWSAAGHLASPGRVTPWCLFCSPLPPTVIEEGGVKMKLTVIDTPGFGDQINNENWYMSACEISALKTARELLSAAQIRSC